MERSREDSRRRTARDHFGRRLQRQKVPKGKGEPFPATAREKDQIIKLICLRLPGQARALHHEEVPLQGPPRPPTAAVRSHPRQDEGGEAGHRGRAGVPGKENAIYLVHEHFYGGKASKTQAVCTCTVSVQQEKKCKN